MPAALTVPANDSLQVRMLGTFRVDSGERELIIPSGRARALFSLLLLVRRPQAREVLVEALWPDTDPERGMRSLSDNLYRLRRVLGPGWIVASGESIGLASRPDLWVDVWEFEAKIADGHRDAVREAVALYAGELLPDMYDDHVVARRASLGERYRQALRRVAADAEREGDLHQAFQNYHWLSFADPLDESAHQGLMRVYMRGGHHSAALQHYERLADHLMAELETEPLPETRALAAAARREGTDPEHRAPRELIGRRAERAAVLAALDDAWSGEPRLVLVEGEAGIGKTRLLEAVAESASWRGWSVAWGRGNRLAKVEPYAPLAEALAEALPRPRRQRVLEHLTPTAVEGLARIIPDVRRSWPAHFAAEPHVAEAVAVVARESAALQPQLWLLDDVHWAPRGFWDAVRFLEMLTAQTRLMVVLAYRPGDSFADESARDDLRRLDRHLAPLRITLSGLTMEECRLLARGLDSDADEERITDVVRLTGGNPLLLQETLASSQRVPPPFIDLLKERLASSTPQARTAMEAAAVLGQRFADGTWLAVVGEQVLDCLPELLRDRFVVQDHGGYAFQHELTHQGTYDLIPDDRRRDLHGRVGDALAREGAPPQVLARHFTEAGRWPDAIRNHRRAAEQRLMAYAYTASLVHADDGLRLLAFAPNETGEHLRLLTVRQRVLGVLLHVDPWRVALDETEALARRLGEDSALLEVLEGRVTLHALDGNLDAMQESATQALELARRLGDTPAQARVLSALGWHLSESLGANDEAVRVLRSAVALAEKADDAALQVTASCRLSTALRHGGRCRAAHDVAARAIALAEFHSDLHAAKPYALEELAEVAMELGRWEEAHAAMRTALDSLRELRDPWAYGAALFDSVIIESAMGRHGEAIAASERVVRVGREAGVSPESDYGAWHVAGLARAHLLAGDPERAERILGSIATDRVLAPRPLIQILTILGQTRLALREPMQALEPLRRATALWRERRQPNDAAAPLHLAIAAVRSGAAALARTSLRDAKRSLERGDAERHSILLWHASFEVTGSTQDLQRAHHELERQAQQFSSRELERSFREDVALNRSVVELWRLRGVERGAVTARLARADAPLGRALRGDERVELRWTVDAGADDRELERRHGSAGLRRHRLLRLLDEAKRHGAAPTDADLAEALDVSRRTVLRDLALLGKQGRALPTRRRLSRSPPADRA